MKESIIFSERNLTEIVHYVYRVIIDGKYYIGKRTGFLNDLITGRYRTSSKLVWEKLENGLHFTKIKIIGVFPTEKEALEFEKRILLRVDAKRNPKFLNQQNGGGNYTFKQHTQKSKKKMSKAKIEFYNTEKGRKQREIRSEIQRNKWDENTEEGRQRREDMSETKIEFYKTEQGRQLREKISETLIQKRIDASILGELMFDEDFIRENFLIIDNKNKPRFLLSVYSKLTGYSESRVYYHKQKGGLSFLYGIKTIKLSEEQENAKIEEIKAIIKSRNEELSLKAS